MGKPAYQLFQLNHLRQGRQVWNLIKYSYKNSIRKG